MFPSSRKRRFRVKVLHQIVGQIVARKFHLKDKQTPVPLVLVLGVDVEYLKLATTNQPDRIYLKTWHAVKFVVSDARLAIERMLVGNDWERICS